MKRFSEILLGIVLWINALVILIAMFSGLSFEEWLIFDIATVIICGLIGFFKKITILLIASGVIVIALILHFTYGLWILIDLFIVGSCGYVGYFFFTNKVDKLQYET